MSKFIAAATDVRNSPVDPECHLWGDAFYPSRLREMIPGIEMHGVTEPGEIMLRGASRGQPAPYGACVITMPKVAEDRIAWMADYIALHIQSFKAAGATDIVYWLYWTGVQGNMEFTTVELRKLADLGIPLAVNYIQQVDDES